jgi:hypothetical protein
MTRRFIVGLLVAGTVVLAAALIWTLSLGVWRNDRYWRLIRGYQDARPLVGAGAAVGRWKEVLSLPDGRAATFEALDETMDISATVTYSDGTTVPSLFPNRTYTNITDVRVDGRTLYVLRSITLFTTERRLLSFDLIEKTVVTDRRVDPRDMQ